MTNIRFSAQRISSVVLAIISALSFFALVAVTKLHASGDHGGGGGGADGGGGSEQGLSGGHRARKLFWQTEENSPSEAETKPPGGTDKTQGAKSR